VGSSAFQKGWWAVGRLIYASIQCSIIIHYTGHPSLGKQYTGHPKSLKLFVEGFPVIFFLKIFKYELMRYYSIDGTTFYLLKASEKAGFCC